MEQTAAAAVTIGHFPPPTDTNVNVFGHNDNYHIFQNRPDSFQQRLQRMQLCSAYIPSPCHSKRWQERLQELHLTGHLNSQLSGRPPDPAAGGGVTSRAAALAAARRLHRGMGDRECRRIVEADAS